MSDDAVFVGQIWIPKSLNDVYFGRRILPTYGFSYAQLNEISKAVVMGIDNNDVVISLAGGRFSLSKGSLLENWTCIVGKQESKQMEKFTETNRLSQVITED